MAAGAGQRQGRLKPRFADGAAVGKDKDRAHLASPAGRSGYVALCW
jgi:hypothetical protein